VVGETPPGALESGRNPNRAPQASHPKGIISEVHIGQLSGGPYSRNTEPAKTKRCLENMSILMYTGDSIDSILAKFIRPWTRRALPVTFGGTDIEKYIIDLDNKALSADI